MNRSSKEEELKRSIQDLADGRMGGHANNGGGGYFLHLRNQNFFIVFSASKNYQKPLPNQ